MNKNIFILIIVLILLLFTFLNDEDIERDQYKISPQEIKEIPDIKISIDKTKSDDLIVKKASITPKINIPKKNPNIKYTTYDASGKYQLTVIDSSSTQFSHDKRSFYGTIDGNRYSINIPTSSLGQETLKLKIKNMNSKEEKTILLSFSEEMKYNAIPPEIDLTFSDIDNYNVIFKSQNETAFPAGVPLY